MNEKFLKPYDPIATEHRIYDLWEKSGYFNPDCLSERNLHGKPFCIVLPPPNVTGTLHMGHAFELTLQDIIVRYKRMRGFRTLWIPGTDHAAIATQAKVEKDIQKKEGKSRHDIGREDMLRRIDAFAIQSHDIIVSQIRKMGCSIDWSREAFTLDEKRSLAVRTAFKEMYDAGLIYRGYRVVNWDPKGQTTISDDEIVYETRKTTLYTFKYSKDIPITISTTRPETKLGDIAIAVHPDDVRYAQHIGKEYKTVFAGETICLKIVADRAVEPTFGTGALGVTPAHSMIDSEMAERHKLGTKQVIDEYGRMMVGSEDIKGKKVLEARAMVVEWLKKENLMQKEEEIEHNIALAERTGGVIEPLPKMQWFVAVNKEFKHKNKMTTLKDLMRESVSDSKIKIIPEHFQTVYHNWIDNLRDWCISRQIWYGHRIPVWYKKDLLSKNNEVELFVGIQAPTGEGWIQDEDTLDTWFSSGLWSFSTLGWPEKTEDLKLYHPTALLCPGYEILFFWVARMILMSQFLLGEIPFETVYLHGIVRDSQGRKFSKSLGNGVDPLDIIAKYGTDALRMALVVGVGPGNDTKFDEQKVKAYKLFGNKLWNITRFILSHIEKDLYEVRFKNFVQADLELLAEWKILLDDITLDMDEMRYYMAGEKIYHYVWHRLADVIIEESKNVLRDGIAEDIISRKKFLIYILREIIRILHPFMPYVTEEIWQELTDNKSMLMMEQW